MNSEIKHNLFKKSSSKLSKKKLDNHNMLVENRLEFEVNDRFNNSTLSETLTESNNKLIKAADIDEPFNGDDTISSDRNLQNKLKRDKQLFFNWRDRYLEDMTNFCYDITHAHPKLMKNKYDFSSIPKCMCILLENCANVNPSVLKPIGIILASMEDARYMT